MSLSFLFLLGLEFLEPQRFRITLEGFLCEPWATLSGHLVLPEGWHGVSRDLQHWSFAEDPEREVER